MDPSITPWDRFIDSFFKLSVMEEYLPEIIDGFWLTCYLALKIVVAGLALGLALALIRTYGVRLINLPIVLFVDIMRALPPLVFILLLYFGLPGVGVNLSGFEMTWLTLSLVLAAFSEEIFRAGILAVPKGQWEASRSTGLGFGQTLIYVVMPQAIRLTVPPLTKSPRTLRSAPWLAWARSLIRRPPARAFPATPLRWCWARWHNLSCSCPWSFSAAGLKPGLPGRRCRAGQ